MINFFVQEYSPSQKCFHNGNILQHIDALKDYPECDYTIIAVESPSHRETVKKLEKMGHVVAIPEIRAKMINVDNLLQRCTIITEVLESKQLTAELNI